MFFRVGFYLPVHKFFIKQEINCIEKVNFMYNSLFKHLLDRSKLKNWLFAMPDRRKSCSFEILLDDRDSLAAVKTPVSAKRLSKNVDAPKKDIIEKMEEAVQRKLDIMQVMIVRSFLSFFHSKCIFKTKL